MAARDSGSLGIEALRHELQAISYLLVIVIYKESFTRESSCTRHLVGLMMGSETGDGLGIHSKFCRLQEGFRHGRIL